MLDDVDGAPEIDAAVLRRRQINLDWYYRNRDRVLANAKARRADERTGQYQRDYQRSYRGRNLARLLLSGCRNRARRKGLPFTLTAPWLQAKLDAGVCEVTGLRFDNSPGDRRRSPRAPSLDRIDPAKGYTLDNTQVVVWHYNAAKHDYGVDDLAVLVRALADKWGPK